MQSELKPCPFCGGEAELFHHTPAGLEPSWHVECSNVDGVYEGCGCGTCHHETAAEAITTWNARASDAEITRLTEALRAAEEREKGLREALVRKARSTMIAELAGLPMESQYRAGIKWCGERIQDALKGPSHD